jgi:hypothetical protein
MNKKRTITVLVLIILSVLTTVTSCLVRGLPLEYLKYPPVFRKCTSAICPMYMPPDNFGPQIILTNLIFDILFWFVLFAIIFYIIQKLIRKMK